MMLAYHNDPAVKAKYELRFAEHRAADAVVQGQGYSADGRGCFVGCTLKNYDHSQFPAELGWPEWLAHLADRLFEGLPKVEAPQFGTDLLSAVKVGVNLEPVRFTLAIKRHERQLLRLELNDAPYAEQVRSALRGVIDYCQVMLDGAATEEMREAADSAARSAAYSAAASAYSAADSAARSARSAASAAYSAYSAADSAASARSAADSAARSAAASARSAADSAARSAAASAASAAASAAETAEYQIERDTLLEILKSM